MRWKFTDLSEVAVVFNGKTPSKAQQRKSGYPVLKIKDVDDKRKFKGKFESFVDDEVAFKSAAKFLKLNDTLILNAAHNADYVGSKQYRVEEKVVGSLPTGEWLIVRTINESVVDSNFLNFYMRSEFVKHQIKTLVKGIHLYPKDVARLQVPLPPLSIQKKIATVLEKADILRQQSQQMEQEFNSLAQSVFLNMFGDPKANPRGWEKRTLGQLVSKLVGGKSLAAPEEQNSELTNRVLKISAVTSGEFNPKESKPLPQDYCPPKDHYVKVNDLLFSRANTTELVGATCIVFETPENVCLPDKLWRFEWQEPEKLSQIFMWKLLNTPAMRNRLSETSSGSGGSMKNISKSKLLEMEVIFPDYDKQLEYEVFYLKLRRQMAMRDRYYIEAENIFNSLMQRAFTGELDLKDVA